MDHPVNGGAGLDKVTCVGAFPVDKCTGQHRDEFLACVPMAWQGRACWGAKQESSPTIGPPGPDLSRPEAWREPASRPQPRARRRKRHLAHGVLTEAQIGRTARRQTNPSSATRSWAVASRMRDFTVPSGSPRWQAISG